MSLAARAARPANDPPPPCGGRRDLEILAADGFPLAACLFEPPRAPRGAVFIAPAMGVTQRFYAPLGAWLAREGFVALTFDYRGIGASKRGSPRKLDMDVLGWAELDAVAALDALLDRAGSAPLTWLGHSLGGLFVPLVPRHARARTIITVALGSGYWRLLAKPLQRKLTLFWWVVVPVATTIFGYFPGRALGMVGDLPAGAIWQWRRWCLHPDYLLGEGGASMRLRFASVTTPVTAFYFADDELLTEAATVALHDAFANAPKSFHRIAPGDAGVDRIGHFGFFRPEMAERLWRTHLLQALATGDASPSEPWPA